jgi:hypothetical protein
MPYKSWYLGFSAPDYMEVWIETADVVDIQDRVFQRAGSGIASMQSPPNTIPAIREVGRKELPLAAVSM